MHRQFVFHICYFVLVFASAASCFCGCTQTVQGTADSDSQIGTDAEDSEPLPMTTDDSATVGEDTGSRGDTNMSLETDSAMIVDTAISGSAPLMDALTITPNPNMTISCLVSWTTDIPATSEVRFGKDGLEFRIVDDALLTTHRITVIGMQAETTYRIRAVSAANGQETFSEGRFSTGALPKAIPKG
ncbi:MAG: hypothetical protein JXX14_22525, partial [Deltaproteobacteria bacterium]|nr:hypothetical protein [Deltaproteobacteria bacterium]